MKTTNKINEEQFFEYINCPTYFNAIYKKHLPFKTHPSMNSLLNRVASSFYLNLMNNKVLRLSDLKRKWDTICDNNSDYVTSNKCLEGIGLLNKMYNWASNEQIRIVDMKVPYVFVNKGNLINTEFNGEIDCIALNNKDQLELLVTDFSNKYPEQNLLDMKLKYSLDIYAFKLIYKRDIYLRIHNVKNNKDFYTYRNQDDFKRLLDSIDSVSFSIFNNIYYPRETSFCGGCDMKLVCKAWHNQ